MNSSSSSTITASKSPSPVAGMLYQSASAMTADRATASATGLFSEPETDVNNVV